MLRKISNNRFFRCRNISCTRFVHSCYDFEQSRFTRSIFSHYSYFVGFVYRKTNITKQSCASKLYGNIIDCNHLIAKVFETANNGKFMIFAGFCFKREFLLENMQTAFLLFSKKCERKFLREVKNFSLLS